MSKEEIVIRFRDLQKRKKEFNKNGIPYITDKELEERLKLEIELKSFKLNKGRKSDIYN